MKSQDIKVGMRLWSQTVPRFIIEITKVEVFSEKKASIVPVGQSQPYLPACVLIEGRALGRLASHTFRIDEEVEQALML